ncbi:RNA polymerase subunit 8 [Trachipleistophora hominis]|uniref:RNA polymerase subunit 8 n=1 Tax=Trachipleistophora hominis TaxID=72359 RepID=L7JTQ0_TRAHO|nr:RNA polymerase subunit 8 [Trachipleistophora hominis]
MFCLECVSLLFKHLQSTAIKTLTLNSFIYSPSHTITQSKSFYLPEPLMEVYKHVYTVETIDKDKKIFNKLSKLYLADQAYKLTIDYHSLLFKPKINDKIEIVIYKGILAEEEVPECYEYVLQGHCYRNKLADGKRIIGVSFGGMLMEMIVDENDVNLASNCQDVGMALRIL